MFDDELQSGSRIGGRFVLERPLGRGAFGAVWLAQDTAAGGAPVAVKILHQALSSGGESDADTRMAREAAVLALLEHPNIARAIAFSATPQLTYLAMEFVDGLPLHEHMAHRDGEHYALDDLATMFDGLCAAVGFAHSHAVVHRDLKPQNVLVQDDLTVKVLDFGIAKLLEGSGTDGTTQGRTIGSLFYLSPEQTRGEAITTASDVFALGSMLFELLTLRRAWAHDRAGAALPAFTAPLMSDGINSVLNVVERIARGPRPRPSVYRQGLPRELDRVVARALAVDPIERYTSAEVLRREVRALLLPQAARGGSIAELNNTDELTAVRPVDQGASPEDELSTVGQGRDRLPSLVGPSEPSLIVPTRQTPGGVSAFLDTPSSTAQPSRNIPALPTVTAELSGAARLEATAVIDRRASMRAPLDPSALPRVATATALTPGLAETRAAPPEALPRAAPSEMPARARVSAPAARGTALRTAGIALGALALVIVTHAVTRAAYEQPRPVAAVPLERTSPTAATPSAVAAPSAIGATPAVSATPQAAPTVREPEVEPTPAARSPSPTARAQRPAEPRRPSPTSAPRSQLTTLLERARQAPGDATHLAALSAAIDRASEKLPDATSRTRIRRMANSSAMMGSLEGLEQAHRELVTALGRAGLPVP